MVVGIDKFREHLSGHEGKYAIIGGAACDYWFNAAGLRFRVTKDIDVVLCVEVVDAEFGDALNRFLNSGGYKVRERSDGRKEFYRFRDPANDRYPLMIELFSRRPDTLYLPASDHLAPIPVEENVASLSAILLEDAYYEALVTAKSIDDDVAIADVRLLIPFKAYAFLNLSNSRDQGKEIGSNSIDKHKRDVFRLAQLLRRDERIEIPERIKDDMRLFLEMVEADENFNPNTFDVPLTRIEGIDLLRSAYQLR